MRNIKTKTSFMIIVVVAMAFTSCENYGLLGIKGSGSVISKNIETSIVEGLNLEISATVYLSKDVEQSIRIDAQQNILDSIETYVDSEVITIKFDKNVGKHEEIYIYISLAHLKQLTISGAGDISSDSEFDTENKLVLNISGSGNIDVTANAPEVDIDISGSGNIKLTTETQKLNSDVSGSGDILLVGESNGSVRFNTSGSGDIKAYDFESMYCSVRTEGSGNAKVFATKTLDVEIEGSGNVYYKGRPEINVSITGSGNIISAN